MAHVVTAKWTAKEGEEGTVLDAIEKRQPGLPQQAGLPLLPAKPRPRGSAGLLFLRDLQRRGGLWGAQRLGALREVRLRSGDPGTGEPRAQVLRDDQPLMTSVATPSERRLEAGRTGGTMP
jgi:hypothetical protein